MKYLFLIIVMTMALFSCDSKSDEQYVISSTIHIGVKDKNGTDLLNSDNENSLDINLIKIYYEVDGKKNEVNELHLDYPKGFKIDKINDQYRIIIFANMHQSEEYPITYIEWNQNDIDTIKCFFERTDNAEICKKVWFNDEIVWDNYGEERYFEIIK